MESPLGVIAIAASEAGITAIDFARERAGAVRDQREDAIPEDVRLLLQRALEQLRAYFDGKLREFDLPLAPEGTPFQIKVWEELRKIPYGTTISYGEQARRLGSPDAVRAVGMANGRNPLTIVIPCHRVIGSNGALTGYAGGVDIKHALLTLERMHAPQPGEQMMLL